MTFGKLRIIGKTFNPLLILHPEMQLVNVYECEVCKSRQTFVEDGCAECKKKAVSVHHVEESKAGVL